MPYKSIKAAQEANFITSLNDVKLTLAQINKLAEIYDAIKNEGKIKSPMAVAITKFKKLYKKEGDKWVLNKKNTADNIKTIRLLTDYKPKERDDGTILFPVAKKQDFHTDGIYGDWSIDDYYLSSFEKNFTNNITGYPIEGYKTMNGMHDGPGQETLCFAKDVIIDNDIMSFAVEPINEEARAELLSGKFQLTSPEFPDNYQDKRTGDYVGPTITRFLFTNQPYQPDLPPAYTLNDKDKKSQVIYLNQSSKKLGELEAYNQMDKSFMEWYNVTRNFEDLVRKHINDNDMGATERGERVSKLINEMANSTRKIFMPLQMELSDKNDNKKTLKKEDIKMDIKKLTDEFNGLSQKEKIIFLSDSPEFKKLQDENKKLKADADKRLADQKKVDIKALNDYIDAEVNGKVISEENRSILKRMAAETYDNAYKLEDDEDTNKTYTTADDIKALADVMRTFKLGSQTQSGHAGAAKVPQEKKLTAEETTERTNINYFLRKKLTEDDYIEAKENGTLESYRKKLSEKLENNK